MSIGGGAMFCLSLAFIASPGLAGKRLVTANLHPTAQAGNCSPTTCPQDVTPPLENLAAFPRLGGSAFHVGSNCQAAKARCEYAHNSRTKILSSDVKDVNPLDVQDWILDIQSSAHELGQIHFEHFDLCLSKWAGEGHPILDPFGEPDRDFPTAAECAAMIPSIDIGPRAMLQFIRDGSGASASETRLLQNGTLLTQSTSPRKLRWKALDGSTFPEDPKRLVGLGYMGALAAGDARLEIEPYMRALRNHNVNFTRVWSVEQWTGQAPSAYEGVTPFAGTFGGKYNLDEDSPIFFDRLRRFAQEAADRGVVVQLSLFDKHGLICPGSNGRYKHSPYKDFNNEPQEFMLDSWTSCSCTNLIGDDAPGSLVAPNCHPLPLFIGESGGQYDDEMLAIHSRYLRRVGEEVGGVGNMLFEVINEALAKVGSAAGDWDAASGGTTMNQAWQKSVVDEMRLSLPIDSANGNHLVRDAFNGETSSPLAIHGRNSDVANAVWTAANAAVVQEAVESGGLGPSRTMGYVTASGAGIPYSEGFLPFGEGSGVNWTKLQVRGDITCNQGVVKLGTKAPNGRMTYIMADCGASAGAEWTSTTVRVLQEMPPGAPVTLAAVAGWGQGARHNVRLLIEKGTSGALTGYLYRDGTLIAKEIAIPATGFEQAFFWASDRETGNYPPNLFKLDNFEATRFCDDASRGCAP